METEDHTEFDIPVTIRVDWRKGGILLLVFLVVTGVIYLVGVALDIWVLLFPPIDGTPSPVLLHLCASFMVFCMFLTVYTALMPRLLLKPHFDGMRHLGNHNYDEALKAFERVYDIFDGHPWREQWEWLFLANPNTYSQREIALINQAGTYLRLGNVSEVFHYLERCLALNPDNEAAAFDLNLAAAVTGGEIRPISRYIPIRATRSMKQKHPWWQRVILVVIAISLMVCCFCSTGTMLVQLGGFWEENSVFLAYPVALLFVFLLIVPLRWDIYRQALPNLHRAERLYRKGEYREGIRELNIQAALLEERPWIEKWGWLILPRLRAYSYREWVLLQMSYGYTQLGEGDRLLPLCQQVLDLNPTNGLAYERMRMIQFFLGDE